MISITSFSMKIIKYCLPDSLAIDGLKGFWPMNSKYGTRDISGNNNHAVVHGNVELASGPTMERDSAYRFRG